MADEVIPEDVKQFIIQAIDSVGQLECLLLLRANQDTAWQAETIAQKLYITKSETEILLDRLTGQGFLSEKEMMYRYQPASTELESMVGRIAEFYSRYLVPITNLIHSKPKSKVQEFANAFLLRKEP